MAPRQLTSRQRDLMLSGFVLTAFLVAVVVYLLVPKPNHYWQFSHMTQGSFTATYATRAECEAAFEAFDLVASQNGNNLCTDVRPGMLINHPLEQYKAVKIDIAPPHPATVQTVDSLCPKGWECSIQMMPPLPKPKPRPKHCAANCKPIR